MHPYGNMGRSLLVSYTDATGQQRTEIRTSVFSLGFTNGGPAGLVYSFIICWIGTMGLFASLAEMASAWVAQNADISSADFVLSESPWLEDSTRWFLKLHLPMPQLYWATSLASGILPGMDGRTLILRRLAHLSGMASSHGKLRLSRRDHDTGAHCSEQSRLWASKVAIDSLVLRSNFSRSSIQHTFCQGFTPSWRLDPSHTHWWILRSLDTFSIFSSPQQRERCVYTVWEWWRMVIGRAIILRWLSDWSILVSRGGQCMPHG